MEKYEKPTEDTEDCLDAILDILHNCEPSEVGTGLVQFSWPPVSL